MRRFGVRRVVRAYLRKLNMLFSTPSVVASLAVIFYLGFRLFHHLRVMGLGFVEGGPLSYDSYYPFAFANELLRSNSLVLFRNPFGSLDQAPLLFNALASVLAVLHPIYSHHLVLFDLGISGLLIWLGIRSLIRLLNDLAMVDRFMIVFGGGGAFLLCALVSPSDLVSTTLSAGFWGIHLPLNWVATPEILYNALFFYGLAAFFEKPENPRLSASLAVAVVFWLLHPFSAVIYSTALFAALAHLAWRQPSSTKPRSALAGLFLLGLAGIAFWNLYLPWESKDAAYFKFIYEHTPFKVSPVVYLDSYFIPLSFFIAILIRFRSAVCRVGEVIARDGRIVCFLLVSGLCIFCSNSYLLGIPVVQPAHWSRSYPFVFLTAAGALIYQRMFSSPSRTALWKWAILVVALLDVGIALNQVSRFIASSHAKPMILSRALDDLVEKAQDWEPGKFNYFRSCENTAPVGELEYTFMARTRLVAPFAHAFFSPTLRRDQHLYQMCEPKADEIHRLSEGSTYIFLDGMLARRKPIIEGFETFAQIDELLILRRRSAHSL